MSDRPAVVFGDVHGDAERLRRLIEKVRARFGRDVDIHGLGDFVDRGPDSRGVLDICVREGVQGIIGNHELWLRNVANGLPINDGIYAKVMGGLATLKSYGLDRGDPDHVGPALHRAMPREHREYVLALPPYRRIEVGGRVYWLIHCGLSSDTAAGVIHEIGGRPYTDEFLVNVARIVMQDGFFWMSPRIREHKLHRFRDGATQILGHVPVSEPVILPGHFMAIDTGCGTRPPYALTAVVLLPDSLGIETIQIR